MPIELLQRNDGSTASNLPFKAGFKKAAQHHLEPIRLRSGFSPEHSRRTGQALGSSPRRVERMILNVRVVPKASPVTNFIALYRTVCNGASKNLVKKEEDYLKVYLTKPAQNGLANTQLIALLAEYLNIKKYQVKIIKGKRSRDKLVKINART